MRPGQCACPSCGEQIIRLFTATARLLVLDPNPSDDGTRIIEHHDGQLRARTLVGPDLPAPAGTGHRLHQCGPPPAPGVRCAALACPGSTVRLLDAYHPDCHPEVTDRQLVEQRARIAAQFKRRRKR